MTGGLLQFVWYLRTVAYMEQTTLVQEEYRERYMQVLGIIVHGST